MMVILRRLYCSEKVGALVTVVRCVRDPTLAGLRGIVIADSKHCLFVANYTRGHRSRFKSSGYVID